MNVEMMLTDLLRKAYPGWGVWRSGTGRWWASRHGTLTLEQIRAGCRVVVDADHPGVLAVRIEEQEDLAGHGDKR